LPGVRGENKKLQLTSPPAPLLSKERGKACLPAGRGEVKKEDNYEQ
jgi:hypothetical protein